MLRSAFLKALEEAQRLGRISPTDAAAKVQWYDKLEATPKFSGLASIGNPITKLQDETGLVGLAALGMTGYGALEGLGALGAGGSASAGGTAAGSGFTAAEGAGIAEGMSAAAGVGGTEAAIGGGMWDWLDTLDVGMGDVPGYGGVTPDMAMQPAGGLFDPTTADLGFGNVDFPGYGGVTPDMVMQPAAGGGLLDTLSKYGSKLYSALFGGGSEGGAGGFSLGQAAFNSTPFLLALAEANRQGDDLDGVIRRINGDAYSRSVLNPYDLDTGMGRTSLMEDQQSRGVRGSSFGQQSLNNYDYMRSLGRGDLFNRANIASAQLEGNLINTKNTNRNLLLGAGLNASGRLFAPDDKFDLRKLLT